MRTYFFPVLVVSALDSLHTGGINLSCMVFRLHYPNIQEIFLPSMVNDATVGATVAVATAIYCACITTVTIFCNSSAYIVLCVCGLVSCIGVGEWIPGTLNANCRLAYLILLVVCSMDRNFMAVAAFLFILLA